MPLIGRGRAASRLPARPRDGHHEGHDEAGRSRTRHFSKKAFRFDFSHADATSSRHDRHRIELRRLRPGHITQAKGVADNIEDGT